MVDVKDEIFTSRLSVLQDFFSDNIPLQIAVDALASMSLSDPTTAEGGIHELWSRIIAYSHEMPSHQDKLVDILVNLSKLPDANTDEGDPLILYDMQVWRDLPMLSWGFRYEWNGPSVPGPGSSPGKPAKGNSGFYQRE